MEATFVEMQTSIGTFTIELYNKYVEGILQAGTRGAAALSHLLRSPGMPPRLARTSLACASVVITTTSSSTGSSRTL